MTSVYYIGDFAGPVISSRKGSVLTLRLIALLANIKALAKGLRRPAIACSDSPELFFQ